MTWRADVPYNELPLLPPRQEIETKRVLKAAIEARAALAALDQAVRRIPNPTVLVNAIPLLEAQASSEIENIVTTTDDIFKFAQDEAAATNPATKETLQYRTALFAGFESVQTRPLSVSTATDVCSIIKRRDMGVRSSSGTYIGDPATQRAIYTPPTGEAAIRDKLTNWQEFVHNSPGFDPVVVMALAHYQFEAIHPFEDGNGRTGRILNILLLVDAGLLHQPILYLSRYIIERKSEYYERLQAVTERGEWEEWVLYLLEGLRLTALWTVSKIDAIHDLQVRTGETIRERTTGGVNADLLAVLFEQPYCRIVNVMERCGVSRPTATGWLNALVTAGVLQDVKVGRERLFINLPFFELLRRDETPIADELEPTLF
jgi:Fic family protein